MGCLEALRAEPPIAGLTDAVVDLTDAQWQLAVNRLAECGLVFHSENMSASLDAHPLVREHFARQLRERQPEAWREGHRRLYEHLKASVPYRPEDLAGLQPLYQAVAHGCHAGLHAAARREVYEDRVLRGTRRDGLYSTKRIGAIGADLGALACFFDEQWFLTARGLSDADQAWLLTEVSFRLRALGRLPEALAPIQKALATAVEFEEWSDAAIRASNLTNLELALGDVASALRDAEQAVTFADRSGDSFMRMTTRTALAAALDQAGQRAAALKHFRDAEAACGESQPNHPLLPGVWGFRYCDLLLTEPARDAARVCAGVSALASGIPMLREAEEHAAKTLAWSKTSRGDSLLGIAINHLSLGRVALYRALLNAPSEHCGAYPLITARDHVAAAVDGLRAAGTRDYLPRSLLTRAWLRVVDDDADGARADLDEARRIAERGSMRLHLADVHLHRARLFHDKQALKEARRLIEECGYHRRDEELQDAEEAAANWPDAHGATQ